MGATEGDSLGRRVVRDFFVGALFCSPNEQKATMWGEEVICLIMGVAVVMVATFGETLYAGFPASPGFRSLYGKDVPGF